MHVIQATPKRSMSPSVTDTIQILMILSLLKVFVVCGHCLEHKSFRIFPTLFQFEKVIDSVLDPVNKWEPAIRTLSLCCVRTKSTCAC